jgi:hypothetical protein
MQKKNMYWSLIRAKVSVKDTSFISFAEDCRGDGQIMVIFHTENKINIHNFSE